jgi:AcrR family transcriptional regulator
MAVGERLCHTVAMSTDQSNAVPRIRMKGVERHEQLIAVARALFAAHGLDGTTVEEIAAAANVRKPVVYEHFGGKEGLYAAVVNREARRMDEAVQLAISTPGISYRQIIERGAMAMLDYIDACPDGFRILNRDSPVSGAAGPFASLLSDVAANVEEILGPRFAERGFDPWLIKPFSLALVGCVASAGQVWLDTRQPSKRMLAAQLANLAWNGLANLEHHPRVATEAGEPVPAGEPPVDSVDE